MPFKSDKQRRYLWSQKPEVAKEIAYKKGGGPLAKHNPMAVELQDPKYKPRTVRPRKGKGSYSRKGAKYYKGGGPLSTLRLGDDAADLARRNLDRIRAGKAIGSQGQQAAKALGGRKDPRVGSYRSNPANVGRAVDMVTDFVPGVGEAKDVARAASNVAKGNYGAAAIDAAAALAGTVPGLGDVAAKGIRNFHGFERASQRVPDLVPDQKTWNTINTKAQRGEDIEIGPITRRDREGKGGKKDTRPGQEGRNAAVMVDGKRVPVVVVPHKDPDKKWHIITTRDRGRDNKNTGVLGGREYNEGGEVTGPLGEFYRRSGVNPVYGDHSPGLGTYKLGGK